MFTARVRARGLVVNRLSAQCDSPHRDKRKNIVPVQYRYRCLFTGTVGTGVRYCTGTVLYRNSTVPVVPVPVQFPVQYSACETLA